VDITLFGLLAKLGEKANAHDSQNNENPNHELAVSNPHTF